MYKTCALFLAAAFLAAAEPRLQIVVVEGQNAINNSKTHTGREPVIEVRDENDAPVAGAVVTFQAPGTGASALFGNGEATFLTQTDASGRAIALGLRPNSAKGPFQIRVTASLNGATASATIDQTNAVPSETKSSSKKVLLIILLAGAAGGGAAAAMHGGKSAAAATTPPSGSIVPGTPVIGPPH
jgi:hypothetical protein